MKFMKTVTGEMRKDKIKINDTCWKTKDKLQNN